MTTEGNNQLWTEEPLEVDPSAARAGLGGRLRNVRQRRLGLTLAEFGKRVAERSGRPRVFSNVTVANWESGRQEPNFATLQAIADLADLPLSYFAGVGELDDFPRVNWFTEVEHANDGRLREALNGLQELPTEQRRLAMAALTGLLEGLHTAHHQNGHGQNGTAD